MAIATMMPMIAGTKYWSATDCSGTGDGVGVAPASATPKAASLYDG
jgi:hypothetical protein